MGDHERVNKSAQELFGFMSLVHNNKGRTANPRGGV